MRKEVQELFGLLIGLLGLLGLGRLVLQGLLGSHEKDQACLRGVSRIHGVLKPSRPSVLKKALFLD